MHALACGYILWHLSDNKKRSVLGHMVICHNLRKLLGVKVAWTLVKMLTSVICVSFSRLVWRLVCVAAQHVKGREWHL